MPQGEVVPAGPPTRLCLSSESASESESESSTNCPPT